ncbi:MAG: FtsW/RodA/SpoVE family cell cycle protein [Planctomycetota bacterium]|jgi:cell division protein FtsW|nr:FtsW/RodA/SpoVE family cell cycle protein [Planctomycetota bacterium]
MTITILRSMLWTSVLALCGLGLVMIASTTTGRGIDGTNYSYLIRQFVALAAGLGMAALISRSGTEHLRKPLLVAAAALGTLAMLVVAREFMRPINGAWRWIQLGPVSIQPAEFAKLTLIVSVAWYLMRVEERVRVNWYGVLLPMAAFAVLAVLVYRTKDLGSIVVLAIVLWTMLFYAGANWFYSLVVGLACVPMVLYVAVFQTAYRRERILAFLDPMNPENDAAYHLKQSFIAIGSGGVNGVGLGQGMSKNSYLPENHTDFIYAVVCEELGLIGGLAVAAGYLLFTWTGMLIAGRTRDRHQRLLAVGCTVLIGVQGFWNMLVVTGALPTKGLTLPFISYGGSSLVVCLTCLGVLDAVARSCPRDLSVEARATSRIGAAVVRSSRNKTEAAL